MSPARWQFWIDRGGTFTDIVGRDPAGALHSLKLLSDDPQRYGDAAVAGIRRLLGLGDAESIAAAQVECVKMGTTVATNALLQRRGAPTVLVITSGFRDALRIGTQARPRLFDRHIVLPEMLYGHVIEAGERMSAHGERLRTLNTAVLEQELRAAFTAGFRSCAIVFLHGYRYPEHEAAAAALARSLGYTQVSTSHDVNPLMKLVPRGHTTVVDAYLSPILRRYVEQLAAQMPGVRLLFMQSSGGLVDARHFRGRDAVLSGPAGGIVGMARTGQSAGHRRLIGFDMGGTSTDVSHFAGAYERVFDSEVAGVRVRAPMMSIHTIAAGGGSVIRFDGARLRVGPESAGAVPGPASYRRGGPLTITDAQLLLGRIQPEHFPQVFGPRGDQSLDREAAGQGFAALAAQMAAAAVHADAAAAAAGAVRIAVTAMANAIKRISVARGHDARRYTLQCFGGAGGQHACLVADALDMESILCHPLAGVLSAYGMGVADHIAMREAAVEQGMNPAGLARARVAAARLRQDAIAELRCQGVTAATLRVVERVHVRYQGTDTALACALPADAAAGGQAAPGGGAAAEGGDAPDGDDAGCAAIRTECEGIYRRRFAFLPPRTDLVIESVSVECAAAADAAPVIDGEARADGAAAAGCAEFACRAADSIAAAKPAAMTDPPALLSVATAPREIALYCIGDEVPGWRRAHLYVRDTLAAGACIEGPAVIVERHATTVVDPGWRADVGAAGQLELRRIRARASRRDNGPGADPVMLEIFNNLFMNIAEQMGLRLQNTAHSVNIKERLDFSCALFDAAGALIANAPHMPVHLGSMSESIRSVRQRNPGMRAGDAYLLNDPYHGGTHLPDITVVTPVFLDGLRPSFFVASRGHHADVGGLTPGSMPPFSTTIGDEGVLIDNLKVAEAGVLRQEVLRDVFCGGEHPPRNPEQNIADVHAQLAANETGAEELRLLVAEYGEDTVLRYMQHVQDNAEECVRRVIALLHDGNFRVPLDNGAEIRLAVRVNAVERSACIDFTGTSAQLADNFNAPRAITVAAVLYVFRTLVGDDIPLNAGCLKPLEIIVPAGCMLNPEPPAAVVAGNVETSTCVANALYGALGVMAAAQCTMNNFTFGDARQQYYETIAGGSGAGLGFAGTAAVQTHMTNSHLTDPEVLEFRFPVRVDSHVVRADSGGAGRWRGGDGALRRIRFLEPMTAGILSNGRSRGAFGLAGGDAGLPGENWIERRDGRLERLGAVGQAEMQAGDVFVIATPGGGGYEPADP